MILKVLVSPVAQAHQAMWAFSGLAHGASTNIATEASCVHPPTATHCFGQRGEHDQRHALRKTGLQFHATSREFQASQASPLFSWSAHRFGSRPYPNSSPMPKPIRVRSPCVALQRSFGRRAHQTGGSRVARSAARAAAGRAAQGARKTRRGSSARSNSIGADRRNSINKSST